ncbi:NAD(FAD)-utilizing enzyme [Pseudomonas chlororaphis subsp. aureofaciens]|uniref:NAD(FAD)-utilizing enzyme n=2 Tax=Pseudomonas chlororaphis TaxID=587753 RepID=A0AAD1E4G9_9PSED|nr:NAD(FAD)-utilizing enzyme [Pseudomonas chlororaphis subsp. aureofaciens]AZE21576.1 NAD(FAD)-utilizing enzyme [Pseudomonas chlororaphis subsp. aureofaciens]AZE27933.1 NAD(FAD)-utilizing enzyme [Pseudomonas chlororaphis subsp. aureofaciens]AZE34178.1 NAD(FAD)-utilizing enzyme [Pseudomonas chlororaphis subsp. aureofaciens]AZE40511.1 NAD(FAD)-utilizing enzyme [Pseudomonas chlororaphis subsp. aureofaciens]
MNPCSGGRMIRGIGVFCMLLALGTWPQVSQARNTLIWVLRDLPPTTIFEGPQKGRGVIDQALPVLMASLPEYDHQIVHVNRARGMQMLREQPFVCDPALMFNLQRAQWIAFSITSFRVFSNGLAVRRKDRDGVQPFIHDGQIDLRALLASAPHNVGVVAERSYGEQIDSLLAQAPPGALMAHYGNSAIGNLLQMQRHGRLKALIGYQPEIRFQAQQQGIDPNELEFYPIQGMPKYQSVNVGCSNTAQGRQAVERINRALLELRPDTLLELYAQWLEPSLREQYRSDALAFFHDAPQR